MTPRQFVNDRLDELEAYAVNALPKASSWDKLAELGRSHLLGPDVLLMLQNDPATVYDDVKAKRRILELTDDRSRSLIPYGIAQVILGELAAPYTDHPDYVRVEWS